MGRVDLERARARLAAETREIEQALARRGHEDDGDDAGRLEHRNLAAILYLDELEGLAEELRDRLAELERAAQCLAADIYGLSVESRHPIPDERFESFPATEQAAEEERALAEGRGG
jgi:NTP pyrophosphatase (non-canonical NTP hydrolase)